MSTAFPASWIHSRGWEAPVPSSARTLIGGGIDGGTRFRERSRRSVPIHQLSTRLPSLVAEEQHPPRESGSRDPSDTAHAIPGETGEADEKSHSRRELQAIASLGVHVEESLLDHRFDDVKAALTDLGSEPRTHGKAGVESHNHGPDHARRTRSSTSDQSPRRQHGKNRDQTEREMNEKGVQRRFDDHGRTQGTEESGIVPPLGSEGAVLLVDPDDVAD